MGMKPRIEQPNKKIDPKLCTEPKPEQGAEQYEHEAPNIVTCKHTIENSKIPGTVSGPKTHA